MKDILMRVTNAEKEIISYLRSLTAFELKDLINQNCNLAALSKVTETGLDTAFTEMINRYLEKIFTEKEFYILRKLQKKTTTGNKTIQVKRHANAIEDTDDSDSSSIDTEIAYSDMTIFDTGADTGFDPSAGRDNNASVMVEEKEAESDPNESILPNASNNIVDKFISRNYRNYIMNANKGGKPGKAK